MGNKFLLKLLILVNSKLIVIKENFIMVGDKKGLVVLIVFDILWILVIVLLVILVFINVLFMLLILKRKLDFEKSVLSYMYEFVKRILSENKFLKKLF